MAQVKGYREYIPFKEGEDPGQGVIYYDVEEGEGWRAESKDYNDFDSESDYLEYMNKIDPISKRANKSSKKKTEVTE